MRYSGQPQSGASRPAPEAAFRQAVDFYYRGNPERSIRDFEALLRREPLNSAVKWELVRMYLETGAGSRAEPLLESLQSEGSGAVEELFIAYCLDGNQRKAVEILPFVRETAETLFYQALLRRDMGDKRQAAELLRRSLGLENFRPIGWFILGELTAESNPLEAESSFRTVLRQDPEFRNAYFPLGSLLLASGNYIEAYSYLNRANHAFPRNSMIIRRLNEAARNVPESERNPRPPARVAERRRITAEPPKVKSLNIPGLTMVRICLAEQQSMIAIKTGGAYTLRSNNAAAYSGSGSEQLWIETRSGRILVQDQRERNLYFSDKTVSLEYADRDSATILSGFTSEDRAYRGSVEFRLDQGGITLINILNIEEYLYGVIPAEMPASWPAEALKAQAVAARSYTLANMGQYRAKGFDLYGSVLSAAYRGVTGEARGSTAAVDATRGLYLRAGGKPMQAYYSANHGGYSEDTVSVWGSDTYNAAVPDKMVSPRTDWLPLNDLTLWARDRVPSYSSAPNLHSAQAYRWEKWVSAEELQSRNGEYGALGDVLQVISRGRGVSGRINEIELKGSQGSMRIKGDRIRSRLGGLRSNLFTIRYKLGKDGKPEYVIFQGAGWGHGVGLDQSGAAGMAQAGFTASQILAHYYPRAELARN
ncbi:MAG: SpoIID/LytB domain-containing protein [Spirochaetaceae bacterium]|jgi:SpoIID/LytB domain protein|nr:SpoIID/LytB domain-containing protein [Spirochaetaceae bacterium]